MAPPPSAPAKPANVGRRNFVKALVGIAAILSITPFVPWGDYLSHTAAKVASGGAQKVTIDNNPKYGTAAGKVVNVNDLTTFPPDSHWVITYPSSGDPTQDYQNPDTFVKFELIRLPAGEFGGDSKSATAFVAFSKVCVHLWCSPNFNPLSGHQDYECPCHGSIYEIPDGKAVQGPASEQPAPTNAIPMLLLQADSDGNLVIPGPPKDGSDPARNKFTDVSGNGIIGYGRNYDSYNTYIKSVGAETYTP